MSSDSAWAVDTSVAIAALDSGHAAHRECRMAVQERRPALAGHAAFEVFSALTRMPAPVHVDAMDAAELLRKVFPEVFWLPTDKSGSLLQQLARLGITGGAVYDALVGEASRVHEACLLTRDRRASRTYDLLGVRYELVSP